jgi:ABC-2 type transport system permease protein
VTWGFIQSYVAQHSGFFVRAGATLIGAMLLWEMLFRGQLGFSVSFLEEMWARNLGNLMMSPLRPAEFVAALMVMSLIRLAFGMVPVFIVAYIFFDFNVLGLGVAFACFFVNLILTSWAIALFVSGLLLRYGLGAESLAWTLAFLILPVSCVYYPVTVLPEWLQPVAWFLPPTYVFEGLRAVVVDHVFRGDLMLGALGLNGLYFGAASIAFLRLLESARREGTLMQTGE